MKVKYILTFNLLLFVVSGLFAQGIISQNQTECPLMILEVNTIANSNQFRIAYCNLGNESAENAYVQLNINNAQTLAHTSESYQLTPDGSFKFLLGTIAANECDEFTIEFNSEHENQCFAARIFPDQSCQVVVDNYLNTYVSTTSDASSNNSSGGGTTNGNSGYSYNNGISGRQQPINIPGTLVNSVFEDNVILNSSPDSMAQYGGGNSNSNHSSSNDNSANAIRVFDIDSVVSAEYCNSTSVTGTIVLNELSTKDNSKVTDNTTVDVETVESEGQITEVQVYPNPIKTTATVQVGQYEKAWHVFVYDVNGKLVLNKMDINTNAMQFNTTGLSKGIYLCNVVGQNAILHSQKIIIH